MTPEERREKQVTENQIRTEKVNACRTAFQQALKDHPQGGIELTKEYTACVQAAQPAKGGAQ
jgi:hypothetical protein